MAMCSERQWTLAAHTGEIVSVRFSADGSKVLTAGRDNRAILWRWGVPIARFTHAGQELLDAQFGPSGQTILTLGLDSAGVFGIRSGKREHFWRWRALRRSSSPPGSTAGATFSPDGRRLVVVGERIRVFDMKTSRQEPVFMDTLAATSADYSNDGLLLLAPAPFGVTVWDARAWRALKTLPAAGTSVTASFMPDGVRVLCTRDNIAELWDAESGERLWYVTTAGDPCAASSPKGDYVAVGDKKGVVRILAAADGKELVSHDAHTAAVVACAFAPDGRRLATRSRDHRVRLWCGEGYYVPGGAFHAPCTPGGWAGVAFASNGSSLVTADNMGAMLWNLKGGTRTRVGRPVRADQVDAELRAGSLSTDGTPVMVYGLVHVLDRLAYEQPIVEVTLGDQSISDRPAHELWGLPERMDLLVFDEHDGTVVVRRNGVFSSELCRLEGHKGRVRRLIGFPGAKTVVSQSADGTIRIWSVDTGKQMAQMEGGPREIWELVVDPNGDYVAGVSTTPAEEGDRDSRGPVVDSWIWDWAREPTAWVLSSDRRTGPRRGALAFSADGNRLVISGRGGDLHTYDARSRRWLWTETCLLETVHAMRFSQDGRQLVVQGAGRDESALYGPERERSRHAYYGCIVLEGVPLLAETDRPESSAQTGVVVTATLLPKSVPSAPKENVP